LQKVRNNRIINHLVTKGRPNCWHSNLDSYAGNVGQRIGCVAIRRRFGRTNRPSAPSA
jgi:hypothetical protein